MYMRVFKHAPWIFHVRNGFGLSVTGCYRGANPVRISATALGFHLNCHAAVEKVRTTAPPARSMLAQRMRTPLGNLRNTHAIKS
jgi:hypothetical protein